MHYQTRILIKANSLDDLRKITEDDNDELLLNLKLDEDDAALEAEMFIEGYNVRLFIEDLSRKYERKIAIIAAVTSLNVDPYAQCFYYLGKNIGEFYVGGRRGLNWYGKDMGNLKKWFSAEYDSLLTFEKGYLDVFMRKPKERNIDNTVKDDEEFIIENGVLKKYNGDGKKITVPSRVKEVLCGFFDIKEVEELVFEEGVESLGILSPFNYNAIKNARKIVIPASLDFASLCIGLNTELIIDENNPYFELKDGMLISKDGKKFKRFFNSKEKSFKVPDGVEVIMSDAFLDCEIESIEMPDSLKVIKYHAFSDCKNLKEVNAGKNLVEVGGFAGCSNLKYIRLPESLRTVGFDAFCRIDKIHFVTDTSSLKIEKGGFFEALCSPFMMETINLVPSDFADSDYKKAAACGFVYAMYKNRGIKDEVVSAYKTYIKRQRKNVIAYAMRLDEFKQNNELQELLNTI